MAHADPAAVPQLAQAMGQASCLMPEIEGFLGPAPGIPPSGLILDRMIEDLKRGGWTKDFTINGTEISFSIATYRICKGKGVNRKIPRPRESR